MDADGASQEERVDLGLQGATWPPSFHLELVIAWLGGEPHKAVALDSVAAPLVDRVDLEEQIWALCHLLRLSQELEVEREGEMAHILGALNVVVIVDQLDGSLAAMRHRVPAKNLSTVK